MVGIAGIAVFTGCAHFHPQPISSTQTVARFEQRSLADETLRRYTETHLQRAFQTWPPPAWDLESLTLAAFYYQPSLDVARARWAVTTAGKATAGERPNPTLSVTPAYNTTTTVPSPWIVKPSLDIPIETAGKRGYRIAQATQLSEVARLNIAMVAWQVRSAVRRSLVNLDAALTKETLLKKQERIQTDNVQLFEAQLEAGVASPFEVSHARVALSQTRFTVFDAERQSSIARLQLAEAIGIPPDALKGIEFNFEEVRVSPADVPAAAARRQALLNRADILGALAEYSATESALQLEMAKQYPDIHLSPGYDYDQGDNKWSLGLSVTLPVLNQNQGAIGEAQARRAESAAKFTALQARVLSEIEQAVASYQIAFQKYNAAEELNRELTARQRTVQAMLSAGEISRMELAQRELELTTAALAELDARVGVQTALGALDDALQSPARLIVATERSPLMSTIPHHE